MEEAGAMKGMIYQHIKTYEMGLSSLVSPRQVRGWYEPQPGIQPKAWRTRLEGQLCLLSLRRIAGLAEQTSLRSMRI